VECRKVESMEEIRLQIELVADCPVGLSARLESRLRDTFALRIPVIEVAAGSLPRHEFKARRWLKVGAE